MVITPAVFFASLYPFNSTYFLYHKGNSFAPNAAQERGKKTGSIDIPPGALNTNKQHEKNFKKGRPPFQE